MEANYVEVINLICEKLGLAASEAAKLIPEIIRRGVATSAVGMAISAIVLCICAVVMLKAGKSMKKESSDCHYYGWLDCSGGVEFTVLVVGVFAIIVAVAAFFVNLWGLVCWIASPNASAIAWILNQFGG